MPNIVYGNSEKRNTSKINLRSIKYDYIYPGDMNLRPGFEKHDEIVDRLMEIARLSATSISGRFDAWNEIDRTLTAYIDLSADEKETQEYDSRKPVSIVFPYSYAILETALSYLMSAFIQEPIFRFEGVEPGDTVAAALLEKVIDLQCNKAKVILNIHTMLRDALCYGFGMVGVDWVRETGFQVVEDKGAFRLFGGRKRSKRMKKKIIYEGNQLYNIDPYLSLPDPNISMGNAQKGESLGWVEHENLMDLLEDEQNDNDLFNVRYLKHLKGRRTTIYNVDNSGRHDKAGSSTQQRSYDSIFNPTDTITMHIKLIPNDWGLGDSEYPELWRFKIGADEVLLQAKKIKLAHNSIPAAVCAPDFDGYSMTPISRLEVIHGMQHTADWYFNAHVANVRKAVNDTLIVDPMIINVNDLEDPKPGGIVRTRHVHWGRGVKDAVMQLQINDVTRQHMGDVGMLREAMERVSGTDAAMMGSLRQGGPERLTSAEFQGTRAGGMARLEKMGKLIGVQSFQDIGTFMASNVQQYMTQDVFVNTVGRWKEQLEATYGQGPIKVSPFDLLIDYDLKVRDGSVPGANYNPVWTEIFKTVSQSEQLMQKFDLVRIFMHIAENSGAKNIYDFIKTSTAPDEQVAQQVQAGNMIPFNDAVAGGLV